jgi:hypothetical protein
MSFDWSSDSPKTIEWAAFFSDCEHEVTPVVSGHRVTLTYNLYTSSSAVARPMRSTEVESFPLYWEVKAALKNKEFLVDGGTIGFFCNHFYAQNCHKSSEVLPQALKGVDMIIHAVSCALRLPLNICPVMETPWDGHWTYEDDVSGASDDETGEVVMPATSQRQMELTFPDIRAKSSTAKKQLSDVTSAKKKIRYVPKSGPDTPNISYGKFEKVEKLVGRGFRKFEWTSECAGEDMGEKQVKTIVH